MTPIKLAQKVTEAVALDQEITELTDQLKALKKELIAEAKSREDEHTPTENGGAAWIARGTDGCVLRVTFPARTLKSMIDAETPAGAKLMALVQEVKAAKDSLFTPVLRYAPIENFRSRVAEFFKPAAAGRIIKMCEIDSSPRVSFETKAEETA